MRSRQRLQRLSFLTATTAVLGLLLLPWLSVAAEEMKAGVDPAPRVGSAVGAAPGSAQLRLSGDRSGWKPIVPPRPLKATGKAEDLRAGVGYDLATKKAARIPTSRPTRSARGQRVRSVPGYQGRRPADGGLKRIIGSDGRQWVRATTRYPWRTIVKLFITAADGTKWIGSGAIIGPSHVLTAGHCIYIHAHGGWVRRVEVIPGMDASRRPYGRAWATNLRTYTGWIRYRQKEHDWALLTLDRKIGNRTGWMGRRTAHPSDAMYRGTLNTAGYPADRSGGSRMYFDADKGRSANQYNHRYYMDTMSGPGAARRLRRPLKMAIRGGRGRGTDVAPRPCAQGRLSLAEPGRLARCRPGRRGLCL